MKLSLINLESIQGVDVPTKSIGDSTFSELSESNMHLMDAEYGEINCSFVTTPNVSLMHGSILLNQAIMLKTKAPSNNLNVAFMLEGNIKSKFYHINNAVQLYKNSHNINYLDNAEGEHILPQGKIKTFHLNISANYFIQNFTSDDIITEKFKNSIVKNIPLIASPIPGYITPEMKGIMYSILNCPYKGGLKKMFIEIKTLEMITMQFFQFADQSNHNILSQKEKQLARQVKYLLEEDFLHHWTLDELARKTTSNIQTLKKSFKTLFNVSIFDYYQHLRLEHSKDLILNQDYSVAEASEFLGYSHQNHFSNAFKNRFGFPPSELKNRSLKPMLIKTK